MRRWTGRKRFVVGLTAVLAIIGAVVGTCLVYDAKTLSEGELRSEVAHELPKGSTQEEIFAFLGQKGASYSGEIHLAADYCCALQDAGIPDDARVIGRPCTTLGRTPV